MKIGIDVDGVLADFSRAYADLMIKLTGKDLFLPGDTEDAPTWHWDTLRGYTKEDTAAAWKAIKADGRFWRSLAPLPGCAILSTVIYTLESDHDLYYITNRPGVRAKWQTEMWLRDGLEYRENHLSGPTVLVTNHYADKGAVCKALKLDAYLDDNWDNIMGVCQQSPETKAYLLTRRYNTGLAGEGAYDNYTRVKSVGGFLAEIGLI